MWWSICSIRRRGISIVWSGCGAMPRCSGPDSRPVEAYMKAYGRTVAQPQGMSRAQARDRTDARVMTRLLAALLFLLLAHWPTGPLAAQYFGQNRVQYRTFDFKVIQTEHFDVYFYEEEREAALDAARMAERSYARLSRLLDHRFVERKPIILYASHSDFSQTNATPGGVSEGIE